ncbi:hypothetical protein S83_044700, partial [Arachis hypogaea]
DAAVLIAFLISAVFHELCIAVPCHKFKLWAFIGIMFQVRTYFPSERLSPLVLLKVPLGSYSSIRNGDCIVTFLRRDIYKLKVRSYNFYIIIFFFVNLLAYFICLSYINNGLTG